MFPDAGPVRTVGVSRDQTQILVLKLIRSLDRRLTAHSRNCEVESYVSGSYAPGRFYLRFTPKKLKWPDTASYPLYVYGAVKIDQKNGQARLFKITTTDRADQLSDFFECDGKWFRWILFQEQVN